jgi:hypothetical protein
MSKYSSITQGIVRVKEKNEKLLGRRFELQRAGRKPKKIDKIEVGSYFLAHERLEPGPNLFLKSEKEKTSRD